MGYPSYARNRPCALPSPSLVHYEMAGIVPAMQLAAHTKSSTLHRHVRCQVQFFSAWRVTTILLSYGATRALRAPLFLLLWLLLNVARLRNIILFAVWPKSMWHFCGKILIKASMSVFTVLRLQIRLFRGHLSLNWYAGDNFFKRPTQA